MSTAAHLRGGPGGCMRGEGGGTPGGGRGGGSGSPECVGQYWEGESFWSICWRKFGFYDEFAASSSFPGGLQRLHGVLAGISMHLQADHS